jgi:serine/threonine protein kinase
MTACPDSDTLSAWVAGTLAEEARGPAIAHIATCARCREAVSALARVAPTAEGEVPLTLRAEASGWVPGATLGRYVIEDVVARGGMGVVLVAHDPTLQRKVAIKVRRPAAGARQAGLEARLVEEARALAQLHHPNVVAVFDAGKDGDQLFLVMELVDGESMRTWLERRPPWREALRVCVAVGRGLEALHRAGLAHRDVKPDNVLLAGDGRVLVADLGLVVRTDGIDDPLLTAHGAVVGTPRYIAPEQLAGGRGDARSDQYGFAVTLREALDAAGEPVPAPVRAVIQRAMDPDPRYRFASMTELVSALDAAPTRRRPRARRAAIALAGLVAAGVTLAAWWPAANPAVPGAGTPPGAATVAVGAPRTSPPPATSGSAAAASVTIAPPANPADQPPAPTARQPPPAKPALRAPARASTPGSAAVTHDPRGAAYDVSPETIAAVERSLGMISTPADYDPKHFDPSQHLALATRMARSWIDDATLSSISFVPVESDGRVNVALMCSGHCSYLFQSPARSTWPEGVPRNVELRRKCEVMVYVEPTRITAQEVNTTNCERPIGPPPRCTFAQVWAKARRRGAPVDLAAEISWSSGKAWRFSMDIRHEIGSHAFETLDLADDC